MFYLIQEDLSNYKIYRAYINECAQDAQEVLFLILTFFSFLYFI